MSNTALDTLYESEERARDQAARLLADAHLRLDQAQARAEQLQAYVQQYQREQQQRLQVGQGVELLQCHQGFMRHLLDAVDQQAGAVQGARLHNEQARDHLQQCEMRLQAVAKLMERRQAQLQHAVRRQEQRALDESGARTHARGHAQAQVHSHFEKPIC